MVHFCYLFSGLLAASSLMVTVSVGSGGGSEEVVSSTAGVQSAGWSAISCCGGVGFGGSSAIPVGDSLRCGNNYIILVLCWLNWHIILWMYAKLST